jgi:iron(III) transport system ATP-binding protein
MTTVPHTTSVDGPISQSPARRSDSRVAIEGVSVSYPGTATAVHEADLVVESGSIVALLGPSGCGKTSLLRAIAGLERPHTGSIRIGATLVSNGRTWVPPERRSVGMVFQDGSLFPHLSVAANVAFGLRTRGADRTRRIEELLALVDLEGLGDRLPDTLSGGQQQRVALARSLAPEPTVLLLDEPFSALDAALRIQVRQDVARILREVGVTTIFVTHDQDEAFVLGDRVAVMRNGRIEQVGAPDELYRTPHNPWVAGFVGEANLVAGRIDEAGVTEAASGHAGGPISGCHAMTPLGPVPVASRQAALVGLDVTVLVRPEQVKLVGGDCAEITAVEYYGHDVRYEVLLDDGSTLAVRTTSTELRQRGDNVCVHYVGNTTQAWPS